MTETSGKNYTNASRCQVCVENVQLTYPTYVTIDKIQQPAEKIEGRKNITINQFLFFSKTSFIYHILLQYMIIFKLPATSYSFTTVDLAGGPRLFYLLHHLW